MDTYVKMMFGENAIITPMNMIVQNMGNKVSLCIAQIPNINIRFGSILTHQLILGDAVIRPHVVLESEKFMGHGAAALATMNWMDWAGENVVMNPANINIKQRLGFK
ncbi:hypothetical protein LCGC14_2211330 [marine sediment metagenome]|uniref:Uncharacterized protein n=1 Tax=marine sediment metagenome TaxID=412755 RepID=A0A0F9FR72_9ZZZZ